MQLKKISSHIYYSEPTRETDRPVLGYITGNKKSIMVDAGNSKAHYEEYLQLLEENKLPTPEICVITHWHWDHTFAIHALKQKSLAHTKTNQKLREMSLWKWTDSEMKKRLDSGVEIPFADIAIREEYENIEDIKVVPATIDIEESIEFDCGEITCQCIHLPSAHSDDSIIVYIPEEKVVFIGDIYGDDLYNDRNRDLKKTEELYKALEKLEFDIAIPGHSEPMSKDRLLGLLKQFLKDI